MSERTTADLETRDKRLLLVAVTFSTFLISLDTSTLNVALPHISKAFSAGTSVTWIVTGYLLGSVISTPASSWIAGRWGTRKPLLAGLAAYALLSVVVSAAPSLGVLVVGRTAVGISVSALIPISMTIFAVVFPPGERGRAMATWSLAGVLGPALGPTVGGQVADLLSWRWLFLGAPVIAVIAFAMCWRWVPELGDRLADQRPRLDARGLLLGPTGLCLLVLALSRGQQWGWSSGRVVGLVVAGIVLLGAFAAHALRTAEPLIDLRLVRVPQFLVGSLLGGLGYLAFMARLVFIPLEMVEIRHLSTTRVGLMFLPAAAATAVGLAVSGRLTDRSGARWPLVTGGASVALGGLAFALWSPTTSMTLVLLAMALHGFGHGMCMGPGAVVAISRLSPQQMPAGSTLRQMIQQLGGVAASAVLGTVLSTMRASATTVTQIQHSYNVVFAIATVAGVGIVLLALRVPPIDRSTGPADTVTSR